MWNENATNGSITLVQAVCHVATASFQTVNQCELNKLTSKLTIVRLGGGPQPVNANVRYAKIQTHVSHLLYDVDHRLKCLLLLKPMFTRY